MTPSAFTVFSKLTVILLVIALRSASAKIGRPENRTALQDLDAAFGRDGASSPYPGGSELENPPVLEGKDPNDRALIQGNKENPETRDLLGASEIIAIVEKSSKIVAKVVKWGKKIKDKRKKSVCLGLHEKTIDEMADKTDKCVEQKDLSFSSSSADRIPRCWQRGTCSSSRAYEIFEYNYDNRANKCYIARKNEATLKQAAKKAAKLVSDRFGGIKSVTVNKGAWITSVEDRMEEFHFDEHRLRGGSCDIYFFCHVVKTKCRDNSKWSRKKRACSSLLQPFVFNCYDSDGNKLADSGGLAD